MNNNWDQLRYFLTLARDKTLSRAGNSLKVSHSTVFRKIKAMEDDLGVTLLENTSAGYTLTAAGLNLLEEIGEVGEVNDSSLRRLNGFNASREALCWQQPNHLQGNCSPLFSRNFKNNILKSRLYN